MSEQDQTLNGYLEAFHKRRPTFQDEYMGRFLPERGGEAKQHPKLLTQEEVNGLEEGTEVMVLWSGGNGPWRYKIEKWRGLTLAGFDGGSHALGLVGSERWNTKVWKVEDDGTNDLRQV